ncbi:hypothetical protein [Streptantibioticus ferralitis]|uniref:Uncharacterized protein n=1 Tax=Streptantibioticus ferralitis TaxID=236510 RepID=A0ABT5ZAP8_9ACTN|nr:hypothetical protein [Streptantibioticus ferralitis]MDF2260916.1 hypothetical protein [Streptantibioticus ferralitis]
MSTATCRAFDAAGWLRLYAVVYDCRLGQWGEVMALRFPGDDPRQRQRAWLRPPTGGREWNPLLEDLSKTSPNDITPPRNVMTRPYLADAHYTSAEVKAVRTALDDLAAVLHDMAVKHALDGSWRTSSRGVTAQLDEGDAVLDGLYSALGAARSTMRKVDSAARERFLHHEEDDTPLAELLG